MRTTDRRPPLVRWGVPRPLRLVVHLVWSALVVVPALLFAVTFLASWAGGSPSTGTAGGVALLGFLITVPVVLGVNFLLVALVVTVRERSPWLGLKRGVYYCFRWLPDLLSS